jgi:hypothetical protein
LYMIMSVFVYMFIFWLYLPHVRENMLFCLSEPGLLHLTWCPPMASIYFQPHVILFCPRISILIASTPPLWFPNFSLIVVIFSCSFKYWDTFILGKVLVC